MIELIFLFLLGLIIGSFLNALIYRLYENEGIGFDVSEKEVKAKRSFCPRCKHQLSWFDLIPILSFIELRAKCRYCKKPISWQYPLVEGAAGLLFAAVFFLGLDIVSAIFYLIIVSLLIVVFVYDLKHYLIPDVINYGLIATAFFYVIFMFFASGRDFPFLLSHILSAIGAFLFIGSIFFVSKGVWMGFGDVKLAFFIGLFLGFPETVFSFFVSFLSGALIGLALVLLGKKGMKSEIPFGPFLALGVLFAIFFAKPVLAWYLSYILFY